MPELPEVEAARRAVEDHCCGKRIVRAVVADDPKVIEGVSPFDFEKSLAGKTIVAAHRKGKNMWLELDSPPFPSFQFGMSGAIYIKGVAVTKYKRSAVNDTDEWPSKYSKLFIELDDGLEFSFTDQRRFAKVRLLQDPASVPPISELGPDAFLEPMSADEFADSLSKKKVAIKSLLLDQTYIAGIGNWVADEVLYQARIHPLQPASNLSRQECKQLQNSIKEVIEKALAVGTDSNQFPSNWIFHFREKKPDKAYVDGKRIEFITAGGRTTAYVPELQKLPGMLPANVLRRSRKEDTRSSIEAKSESGNEKQGHAEKEGVSSPPAKRRKKASSTDGGKGQQTKVVKSEEGKQIEVSKKTTKIAKKSKEVVQKKRKK